MSTKIIRAKGGVGWRFDNSYIHLPESLYAQLPPTPVRAPEIAILNHTLAESLGLNIRSMSEPEAASLFSGNVLPDTAQPIAQAYAGHQFGHFTMLGDGRAVLLGEHLSPNGNRHDIQLKGSGQTKFSRRGDGRAALAPMLREYIISEAMHALNVPTTRSLAVVTTGESVMRESILPGAILTRVAKSHLRVGTFEYVARMKDSAAIKTLADYTIHRHYPEINEADNPYFEFLKIVLKRQTLLVAKWMLVGFIHGVMNTDNMSISGETIDYGPCAFMDTYDPHTVFSSIDRNGRYSFSNQPHAAQWNLARFAETLIPLLHTSKKKALTLAEEVIHTFPDMYHKHWLAGMRNKLGLFSEENDDTVLIENLLAWMKKHQADYTNSFRELASEDLSGNEAFRDAAFVEWHTHWQARLSRQSEPKESSTCLMLAHNPAIIPRNHRVEKALTAASEHNDYSPLQQLLAAITNPYDELPCYNDYRDPPAPSEHVYQTFCGT